MPEGSTSCVARGRRSWPGNLAHAPEDKCKNTRGKGLEPKFVSVFARWQESQRFLV